MFEQQMQSHSRITLEFQVLCQTNFGQEIRICGSSIELGNWNPLLGHRLVTDANTYPKWKSYVPLIIINPNPIEYKACIIANNKICWERNVQNRQIACPNPTIVEFVFNQPQEKITEKKIFEIDCREGTWEIIHEMQGSQSSIEFKSNYPIERYFKNSDQGSLDRSRGLSWSQLSSNLFSPNGFGCGSEEGERKDSMVEFDNFSIRYKGTPELVKSQSIRPQIIRRSDQAKLAINLQNIDSKRKRSKSRSLQRSESGNNKSQDPMSPYLIHIPSQDDIEKSIRGHNSTKKVLRFSSSEMKAEIFPTYKTESCLQQGTTECSQTHQKSEQNKSTSTVIEYDTEDEYFTTREEDVAIQTSQPEFAFI